MAPSTLPRPVEIEHPSSTVLGEESGAVRETIVTAGKHRAHAFVGGQGAPLVLVHGGWGGASTHWSSVWGPLAQHFRIIAPDLPGIGDPAQPGLGSLGAYAVWLRSVLDALRVPTAWFVGNSFGVSVICRFALDFPERCLGLVFVNGFPMPETPGILRWLGERRLGRRLMTTIEKQVAYRPGSLQRGFFDSTKVPDEIRNVVQQKSPPQAATLAEVLVQGGGSSAPDAYPVAPLLLWGEEDHLPGTSAHAARKLAASWRSSKLAFVPRAGHLPQVENPEAFVNTLVSFVEESGKGH